MTEAYDKMIAELAKSLAQRYHYALLEGKTEQQVFEEIVKVILEGYREAMAS